MGSGMRAMADGAGAVDDYLRKVPSAERKVLETMRKAILSVAPDAEQMIRYGMPTFKVDGKPVAHFAAFKDHMSFFPGAVLRDFGIDLEGFETARGTIRFTLDKPLPLPLVKRIVRARINDIRMSK